MATLIPEKPGANATPAVARLFRVLSKLPDEHTVWLNLQPGQPHFLVLTPGQSAFLIHVAETSEELALSALQLDLLDRSEEFTPDSLAADELHLLDSFPLPPDTPVRRLLVFPNATQGTLDQVVLQRSRETEVRFLGLQQASTDAFLANLLATESATLLEPALYTLRASFTPESVIPSAHRPTLIEREREAENLPVFLDLDQEKLFKLDLLQPPPGEDTAASSRLVTGPAGSGKSLVLLHRALLAARLHEGARLLVLTHNKPLNSQLESRFRQLAPGGAIVEWRTFFSWAAAKLRFERTPLPDYKVRQRVASLQAATPALSGFQPDFLADEINYLRDLGVASLDEYLSLERSGRLSALQAKARESIWKLLLSYRRQLAEEKLRDWHEVALEFYDFSRSNSRAFMPGYDFIFIDEAQFFAKVWFAPVLAALKPSGQLFLSADPTQGFMKRRQSWRELGINVTGRAHRLGRVYRSTRQIAAAARHFFEIRQPATQEKDLADTPDLLTSEDLALLPIGEQVHIFACASPRDEADKAAELVKRQLQKSPHLRGHILVIHADSSRAYHLKESLEGRLGSGSVRNLQDKTDGAAAGDPLCLVSSLHAATGLEATSVILLGLDSLLEKEDDPTLAVEDANELRAANTRLIYVALTRAVARLSIVTRDKGRWHRMLDLSSCSTS